MAQRTQMMICHQRKLEEAAVAEFGLKRLPCRRQAKTEPDQETSREGEATLRDPVYQTASDSEAPVDYQPLVIVDQRPDGPVGRKENDGDGRPPHGATAEPVR